MSNEVKPFEIHIVDEALADLHDRLSRTRWPDQVNDEDWSYGTELSYLKELCNYWRNEFDWRAQEARLNRFPQFTTEIDGLNIHFIHVRSKELNALPLIITHGWPGSVIQFTKIIGPLTDPVSHGGQAQDAFHVICPSMPGFGFSDASPGPGMSPQRVADIEAKLMARLGYSRYGVQGGDWGPGISTLMGIQDATHCVGIHLNLATASPPEGQADPTQGLTPKELGYLQDTQAFQDEGSGYLQIQSTRPQSREVVRPKLF